MHVHASEFLIFCDKASQNCIYTPTHLNFIAQSHLLREPTLQLHPIHCFNSSGCQPYHIPTVFPFPPLIHQKVHSWMLQALDVIRFPPSIFLFVQPVSFFHPFSEVQSLLIALGPSSIHPSFALFWADICLWMLKPTSN